MFKNILLITFIGLSFSSEALQDKFLLVTGCGRSGTKYISSILQKAGIDTPHETLGREGTVSWFMTFNILYYSNNSHCNARFKHIFHQVRNPLDTISSVYYSFDALSWSYIHNHMPQISRGDSLLEKSAKYWYYWNLKADSFSEWTYKIEDIDHVWGEFCRRLGVRLDPVVLKQIPKDMNTWNTVSHRFTWKELQEQIDEDLYHEMQALAWKYGYPIKD